MSKKDLSERDICTKYITPAMTKAGWDVLTQVRENVHLTKGRVIVGTRPGYNTSLLESIVLPIPPLEEQTRIVAKVEQLMRVCDDLEAKLRGAEDRAAKLAESAVRELVSDA